MKNLESLNNEVKKNENVLTKKIPNLSKVAESQINFSIDFENSIDNEL